MQGSLLVGVGLLSLAASASSALAADLVVKAPPGKAAPAPAQPKPAAVQATPNWSGTQVGGFNGASQMSNTMVEPGAFQFFSPILGRSTLASPISDPETPFSVNGRAWSYTVGGFVGYNWQLGNYVVGVESDAGWKNGQSSSVLYTPTLATYVPSGETALRAQSFNGVVKQTWDSSARVRGGFLATPWTLIYATGGLAVGGENGSFDYTALTTYPTVGRFAATSGGMSWSDTRVGWTAGAGVEEAIVWGWKIRVEYRYTDFGTFSKNIPLAFSTNCAPFDGVPTCTAPSVISSNAQVNLHPSFQTIRVGVGYTF
jgi:outer membrane immunogenic protein